MWAVDFTTTAPVHYFFLHPQPNFTPSKFTFKCDHFSERFFKAIISCYDQSLCVMVSLFTSKDECVVVLLGCWLLLCEARPILDLHVQPQKKINVQPHTTYCQCTCVEEWIEADYYTNITHLCIIQI